ncbi:unnamed protein product, partial [Amoebophrya sp. A120]
GAGRAAVDHVVAAKWDTGLIPNRRPKAKPKARRPSAATASASRGAGPTSSSASTSSSSSDVDLDKMLARQEKEFLRKKKPKLTIEQIRERDGSGLPEKFKNRTDKHGLYEKPASDSTSKYLNSPYIQKAPAEPVSPRSAQYHDLEAKLKQAEKEAKMVTGMKKLGIDIARVGGEIVPVTLTTASPRVYSLDDTGQTPKAVVAAATKLLAGGGGGSASSSAAPSSSASGSAQEQEGNGPTSASASASTSRRLRAEGSGNQEHHQQGVEAGTDEVSWGENVADMKEKAKEKDRSFPSDQPSRRHRKDLDEFIDSKKEDTRRMLPDELLDLVKNKNTRPGT